VLLHIDDPDHIWPWLDWDVWLELVGAQRVKPAGALRFSHYDQMIQATLEGHGIALGRSPLVDRWIKEGRLVLPFGRRFLSSPAKPRAYFILTSPAAAGRPEVAEFARWLLQEARAANDAISPQPAARSRRR
jgi:DNA-binding transcriptional LysR family regulator